MDLGKLAYLFMPQPSEENIRAYIESQNPSPPLSEGNISAFIESRIQNLPLSYWQNNAIGNKMELNSSCAKMPDPLTLRYNNLYWQEVVTTSFTLYLYAAYLDVRKGNTEGAALVRLLGMTDKLKPRVPLGFYCQLWFENSTQPVLSEVSSFRWLWVFADEGKEGNRPTNDLQPYLLTCPVPAEHANRTPILVSVTEGACDTSTALLKVIYNKPEGLDSKKNFAVCVKGLDMPDDLSVRLAEWIELVIAMGADKIFLYSYEVHPKVGRLVEEYAREGKIDLRIITLPGPQPNLPGLQHMYIQRWLQKKRFNELIPYNDCLYRNIYR